MEKKIQEKQNFLKEWQAVIKSIELKPLNKRRLPKHKPFKKWTSDDYDMAANAVADAMKLTSPEWGIIRYAIRMAVEENSEVKK